MPRIHPFLNLKAFLFGIAVFNYVSFWFKVHVTLSGGSYVLAPWYSPLTNFNEPALILIAACLLYAGRKWTYLLALGISGYLVVLLLSFILAYEPFSLHTLMDISVRYIDVWQSQYILASVILTVTGFELIRNVRSRPLES